MILLSVSRSTMNQSGRRNSSEVCDDGFGVQAADQLLSIFMKMVSRMRTFVPQLRICSGGSKSARLGNFLARCSKLNILYNSQTLRT